MPVLKRHPGRRRRQHRHRARAAGLLAGLAGRPDRGAPAARPVGRADPGHRADQRSVRLPAAAARRRPVLLRRADPGADRPPCRSRLRSARSTSSGCSAAPASASASRRSPSTTTGTASEGAAPARSSIARAVGVTVSAIIILFAAIGALQILQISAISDPATNMLNTIALAIPNVLAALVWLTLAFIIGRWVKSLLETVLPSLGFDNAVRALGVMPATCRSVAGRRHDRHDRGDHYRPDGSGPAGRRRLTAALLFQITELGGKVIFGTVIIVVGLFLARILAEPGRQLDRRGQLCPDDRQICDHRAVHRDRPDLHGPRRPDRDDGVRPDPWLGGGRDRARVRPRRPRLCRAACSRSGTTATRHRAVRRPPPPRLKKASPPRGRQPAAAWCEPLRRHSSRSTGRAPRDARHKGIAIAEARGDDAPRLVRPGHVWSREEVLDWLLKRAAKEPTLFGFDFSFAPPFAERGAYLPGEADVPDDARELLGLCRRARATTRIWAPRPSWNRSHRRHFYFGIADGVKADFMHFRHMRRSG